MGLSQLIKRMAKLIDTQEGIIKGHETILRACYKHLSKYDFDREEEPEAFRLKKCLRKWSEYDKKHTRKPVKVVHK